LVLSITTARESNAETVWWCKDRDLNVASIRLRGELVMRQLGALGHAVGWYEPGLSAAPRCLIVGKRSDAPTVDAVEQAKAAGSRIVIDFCDNTFMPSQATERGNRKVDNLRRLVSLADAIVAATQPLATIIRERCPDAPRPLVIGDLADDLSVVPASPLRQQLNRYKLWNERRALQQVREKGLARLVWFGNNGGRRGQSGYADLARLLPVLERLNRTIPLHLSVISNHRGKYLDMVRGTSLSNRYIGWDAWTFEDLLREHDVALIPAQVNAYSMCKTDNRVVTSLRAGVPVAADRIPSYERFANVISLGDIESGLRDYLCNPELRARHVRRGQLQIAALTEPSRIVGRWEEALGLGHRVTAGIDYRRQPAFRRA